MKTFATLALLALAVGAPLQAQLDTCFWDRSCFACHYKQDINGMPCMPINQIRRVVAVHPLGMKTRYLDPESTAGKLAMMAHIGEMVQSPMVRPGTDGIPLPAGHPVIHSRK